MAASVQDGCYAWAVCAVTFLVLVIHGGLVFSMGVFYIMFQQGLDAGDSALSLITSLNLGIIFITCPFAGILTEKYGERPLAITGAFLVTTGLVCSSFSTEPYHLYLSYSLIAGIGGGMVYNPCISILEKYFKKYMRVAAGLAVCGSGVGSFVFPPIVKALEDRYGWRGALLLVAGIYSHIIVFSCLYRPVTTTKGGSHNNNIVDNVDGSNGTNRCVHKNNDLPVQQQQGEDEVEEKLMQFEESNTQNGSTVHHKNHLWNRKKEAGCSHSLKASDSKVLELQSQNVLKRVTFLFKRLHFMCICLYSLLAYFPTILVYTHLGSYILTLGFTKSDVVSLYIVIGITTTITRTLFGALAEFTRASPSIIVTVSALINGVLTILLPFTFTHNLTLIYVYGVLFSILLAPYDAFCLALTVDSVHESQVATGFGVVCFFCVPGSAFGAPLAAWLYDYTTLYASSFYLAGGLFILSALTMIPTLWQMYVKGSTERMSSCYNCTKTNQRQVGNQLLIMQCETERGVMSSQSK